MPSQAPESQPLAVWLWSKGRCKVKKGLVDLTVMVLEGMLSFRVLSHLIRATASGFRGFGVSVLIQEGSRA